MAEDTEKQTPVAADAQAGAPAPENSGPPGEPAGVAAALEAELSPGNAGGDGGGEPAKRGRGRPPTHGRYSKANGSDGKSPVSLPVDDAAGGPALETDRAADLEDARSLLATLPPDLRDEIAVELLSLGEEFARDKISDLAAKCDLTPSEIEANLGKTELGGRRKKLIAKLLPHAAKELAGYFGVDLDPELSPLGAVLTLAGPPLARFGFSWVTLARIAKERQAERRREQTSP